MSDLSIGFENRTRGVNYGPGQKSIGFTENHRLQGILPQHPQSGCCWGCLADITEWHSKRCSMAMWAFVLWEVALGVGPGVEALVKKRIIQII